MSLIRFFPTRSAVSGGAGLAALAAGALLLLGSAPARAQVVAFTAFDSGAGPGVTPTNSNAEAAQFDTAAGALGSESLINFESAPVGSFTSLTAAPGVTLTGSDFFGNSQTIKNVPDFSPAPTLAGFNTTLNGANYVDLQGGTLTFAFTSPIQAFGAYFTGVQPGYFQDTIGFSDGTSQSIDVTQGTASSNGGVSFAGFTDTGKSIQSITITASGNGFYDAIGIDDMRFVPAAIPAAVPEAATTVSFGLLLALGVGGVVIAAQKKKTVSVVA